MEAYLVAHEDSSGSPQGSSDEELPRPQDVRMRWLTALLIGTAGLLVLVFVSTGWLPAYKACVKHFRNAAAPKWAQAVVSLSSKPSEPEKPKETVGNECCMVWLGSFKLVCAPESEKKFYHFFCSDAELSLPSPEQLASKRILMIGSTATLSNGGLPNNQQALREPAFDPFVIKSALAKLGVTNVTVEDVFRSEVVTTFYGGGMSQINFRYELHSLAQYMFWPEVNLGRLSLSSFDFVVLMHDPHILVHEPGFFAEGIFLLADKVQRAGAVPLVLLQWPGPGSQQRQDRFTEITYRTAENVDLRVVPAGLAWDSFSDKDGGSARHPSPIGADIAAMSIFAEIFDQAPANSDMAKHAFQVVRGERAKKPHFSGRFRLATPFTMGSLTGSTLSMCHTGTSSERGITNALLELKDHGGAEIRKESCSSSTDFNLGRGNTMFEPHKQYNVDSGAEFSFGFPMGDNGDSDPAFAHGLDRRGFSGGYYDDGVDLGICDDMVRLGQVSQGARCLPNRLLLAKIKREDPSIPTMSDKVHMSKELDMATASYLYTIISGKCAVGPEPGSGTFEHRKWVARKVGAETAFRLGTLSPTALCVGR